MTIRCSSLVASALLAGTVLPALLPGAAVAAPATPTVPVGIASVVTVVGESTDATPAAANTGATTNGGATTTTAAPKGRIADPLSDLAAFTLDALKANAGGSGPANVGGVLSAPTPAALPAADPSTAPALTLSASGAGWSSAVVDTVDVSALLDGAVAVNPASASRATIVVSDASQRYPTALAQLANLVASRVKGMSASSLLQVWLMTDARRMSVLLTALAQTGTYYRWAGNQPGGFDCSGLTSYAWSAAGVKIPRTSGDQIAAVTPKTQATLKPGDLVYRPGHIGMYLGVGEFMVHSPQTGKPVEVSGWGRITRMGSPLG